MKALDPIDEEGDESDCEARDNAADAPQALSAKQENDTKQERRNEAERPGGIHIWLALAVIGRGERMRASGLFDCGLDGCFAESLFELGEDLDKSAPVRSLGNLTDRP